MPDIGVEGHDPNILARHLEYLRRRSYSLIGLSELLKRLDEGILLDHNALVFTVDDGYADFAQVAAPIFAKYDCPVTVFLVTDFVAGRMWNWFDRVAWAFVHTPRHDLSVDATAGKISTRWRTTLERQRVSDQIVTRFKAIPDSAKEQLLAALVSALEVDLPDRAPAEYEAMDWDSVRKCASMGVTFGPHTISHPVLSRVDDSRAAREILGSWQEVRSNTEAAVPVFCYPNGGPNDFSNRDKALVAQAGMKAAVSGMGGCVMLDRAMNDATDRFSLPRFPYSDNKARFVQVASGLEAMKARLPMSFS